MTFVTGAAMLVGLLAGLAMAIPWCSPPRQAFRYAWTWHPCEEARWVTETARSPSESSST